MAVPGPQIECVQQANAFLGEAPIWHPEEKRLYWADVGRPCIYAYEAGKGQVGIWPMPSEVGFLVPRAGGGVVAGLRAEGIVSVEVNEGGTLRPIVQPAIGKPPGRFNDAQVDAKGRLWTGWLTDSRVMPGTLYRIDPGGAAHAIVNDVTASNGMGWSPDGRTFYYTDSHIGVIWASDFDMEAGAVGERRPFLELDVRRETPDGMQVDADGCVWTAVYRGGRLIRLSPDGSTLDEIALPVSLTTSCAFGGPDLRTLYVTSAIRQQSGDDLTDQPAAGGLFALDAGVAGLPGTTFKA